MACPRFSTGKLSSKIACETGCKPPPAAPCTTRATISITRLLAAPHHMDASVNRPTERSW
jgi:hypothetical protein